MNTTLFVSTFSALSYSCTPLNSLSDIVWPLEVPLLDDGRLRVETLKSKESAIISLLSQDKQQTLEMLVFSGEHSEIMSILYAEYLQFLQHDPEEPVPLFPVMCLDKNMGYCLRWSDSSQQHNSDGTKYLLFQGRDALNAVLLFMATC